MCANLVCAPPVLQRPLGGLAGPAPAPVQPLAEDIGRAVLEHSDEEDYFGLQGLGLDHAEVPPPPPQLVSVQSATQLRSERELHEEKALEEFYILDRSHIVWYCRGVVVLLVV